LLQLDKLEYLSLPLTSTLAYHLHAWLEPIRVEHLLGLLSNGRLQALSANVRQGWKCITVASTLAYRDAATITVVKSFIVQVPELVFTKVLNNSYHHNLASGCLIINRWITTLQKITVILTIFSFRHHFHIMSPKFWKFKRVQNVEKKIQTLK
jgi:hypothetical protein